MSKPYKRRHKFIDRQVQGSIVLRTITYWALCVLTIASMLLVWRIVTGPPHPFYVHLRAMWYHYAPVAVAAVLLLPILVIDVVAMSHRFAGPILRLRRSIRRLADGEHVDLVHFRENDFWKDFAHDFNRLVVRVQSPPAAEPSDRGSVGREREEETLVGSATT